MAPAILYKDPPELDHIIHLVSPGKLDESIEQFKLLGFSVERGGVHADGLTQNALIVLTDGVYIELIEFLDNPMKGSKETLSEFRHRRNKHWWWGQQAGWIDWCLAGGCKDGRAKAINRASKMLKEQRAQAAGSNSEKNVSTGYVDGAEKDQVKLAREDIGAAIDLVQYDEPVCGGRRALSGKEIKWNVTFPSPAETRGTYPFWCEDQTPRWWRVPTPSPPHPSLTEGLAALTLLYRPENFPARLASLQLILSAKDTDPSAAAEILNMIVDTRPPPETDGRTALPDASFVELFLATPQGPLLPLRIKAADDPAELAWLAKFGEGLYEVEISVAPEKLPLTAPPDGIERETSKRGYGRLRLHPMRFQT